MVQAKSSTFYVDGVHAVEALDGTYIRVTYYSLVRPRCWVERRVLPLIVVRPRASIFPGGRIEEALRQMSGINRLHA